MWHMTCMTCDKLYVTRDMGHVVWGEHSLKMSAPKLLRFEDLEEKADWLTDWHTELITKVFVEQPRLPCVF